MTSHHAPDFEGMLACLAPAIARANAEIMAVRRQGAIAREKADRSPVTLADERAEKVLLAALAEHWPQVPVVAEENAAATGLPADAARRFFLVDPLDGTKEFLKGGLDFTVNVALVEEGVPIFGIVACPADGRFYAGAHGLGAVQAVIGDDGRLGERHEIHTRRPVGDPPVIVASKSHRNAETDAWLAHYPQARLVSIGSSLKFCLVAEGKADLYPRLGPTMEWDTAAGDAVLRAAGGRVLDARGQTFGYGKPGFRNGWFIAFGDPDFRPAPLPKEPAEQGWHV